MPRLRVLVEGETEETFVQRVLGPVLYDRGFHEVSAKLLGNARMRSRRGGIRHWPEVSREICLHLSADSGVSVTTMVDYYGLPEGSGNPGAWPGRTGASSLPFQDRARCVEDAMAKAIAARMGPDWDARRFIPFVVMHEFEGLLFSDCARIAQVIGRPQIATRLEAIRGSYSCPEEINDSQETHPSKRIETLFPGYQKLLHGIEIAQAIGLNGIAAHCPHFRDWIERLESIA